MKIKIGNKVFEVSQETLEKAQKENTEIELGNDFIIRTKSEQDSWFENVKEETIATAIEMRVKDVKKKEGLDFEGKTIDNLIKHLKQKVVLESTKEPSDLLAQSTKDIELLKSTLKAKEDLLTKVDSEFKGYKNQILIKDQVFSNLPKNSILPQEDLFLILQNKLGVNVDEKNRIVFSKNGELLKDSTTLEPLPTKTVLDNFFAENQHYLSGANTSFGQKQDSQNTPKKGSLDSFNEKWVANGKEIGGAEYSRAISEAVMNKEIEGL